MYVGALPVFYNYLYHRIDTLRIELNSACVNDADLNEKLNYGAPLDAKHLGKYIYLYIQIEITDTHIYTYTYIHTYIHIYIYIHIIHIHTYHTYFLNHMYVFSNKTLMTVFFTNLYHGIYKHIQLHTIATLTRKQRRNELRRRRRRIQRQLKVRNEILFLYIYMAHLNECIDVSYRIYERITRNG